jgi:hypothetical protein
MNIPFVVVFAVATISSEIKDEFHLELQVYRIYEGERSNK